MRTAEGELHALTGVLCVQVQRTENGEQESEGRPSDVRVGLP
jgi:hypothetical protein